MGTLFNPSLSDSLVCVTATGDGLKYTITWPAQTGSDGYRVYAGFDPLYIRSLISGVTILPSSQHSFSFDTPVYPPGQIIYFWVASITYSGVGEQGGQGAQSETRAWIDDYGAYAMRSKQATRFEDTSTRFSDTSIKIIAPEDGKYYMEEIRRRAKAILEDVGEEVDLFIKQWRGLPDPSTQEEMGLDPNYQPMTRDDKTYGVGFFPGYFPAVRMWMRFGGLPTSQFEFQIPGMRPLLPNEAWTIWDPIMHENDLIVRVDTGQRYVVNSTAFGNWRSVPISQRLSLEIVTPTSPLQAITDSDVRVKWASIPTDDYMKAGFGVAGGPIGDTDFIIM